MNITPIIKLKISTIYTRKNNEIINNIFILYKNHILIYKDDDLSLLMSDSS